MAKYRFLLFYCVSCLFLCHWSTFCNANEDDRKVHIVYMGSLSQEEYLPSSHHLSMLQEVVQSSSVADTLVRSYGRSFNGFAAKLNNDDRQKLASMKGVVSVFPSETLQLHTTRSWDFMGFNESIIQNPSIESDLIIGVIDTGIWPESESFNDEGFGPAPIKWKGACRGGENFTCNNKIVGARYYSSSEAGSARDENGHGSHTTSTAAGNKVKGANFFGLAQGIARGGFPSARIAAYKVCNPTCQEANILAAFDDAIADGVDLITISIGSTLATDFTRDPIAIGAFHAMEKGILTLQSAGNNGPDAGTVSSIAPWLLSVAASTTDRLFIDKVLLGDGKTIIGSSINTFTLNGTKLPLAYGKEVSRNCSENDAELCYDGCIETSLVKGKIVLCRQFGGYMEANRAGAAGSIMTEGRFINVSNVVSLPASAVSPVDYNGIISYLNSTKIPQAEILKSEIMKDSAAPAVTSFSSRGPNIIVPEVMKPDVSAPGVNILAAYSPQASLSEDREDKRRAEYNIISGTSMACPHAAGAAAYVKSFHPDWSPSAIKSAIMTTAWPMNASKNSEAEFAYGSGHINPVQAVNPGLVYEAFKSDYITMLCSLGFDEEKLRIISGDNSTCPKNSDKASPKDLNHPSMTAEVAAIKSFTISFHRTVTNVGLANSTYKADILRNPKISVKVVPEVLSFRSLKENMSFNVTVTGGGLPYQTMVSTSLVWSDGTHSVRSPVIVHTMRL